MEFLKQNFIGLVAIILFLFLWFGGCGGDGRGNNDTPDTIRVETVYVPQPPVIIPQFVPTPVGSTAPIVIPPNYQPAADYAALLKQYNELAAKHLTTNEYKESVPLKDSSGKQVGVFNIGQKVRENEIQANNFDYQLNFPRTTVTLAQDYRRFYAGGGITLVPTGGLVAGIKGNLSYKDKKDRLYGVELGVMKVGTNFTPYGGLNYQVPIGKKKY